MTKNGTVTIPFPVVPLQTADEKSIRWRLYHLNSGLSDKDILTGLGCKGYSKVESDGTFPSGMIYEDAPGVDQTKVRINSSGFYTDYSSQDKTTWVRVTRWSSDDITVSVSNPRLSKPLSIMIPNQ